MAPEELGGGMFSDGSPDQLIDDMAQPFLDIAERLEAARLNETDDETWVAILETNMFLWRFTANFLPRQMPADMPAGLGDLLHRISRFMKQAGYELQRDRNDDLINRVIELNLNMCDQILAMRPESADREVRAARV